MVYFQAMVQAIRHTTHSRNSSVGCGERFTKLLVWGTKVLWQLTCAPGCQAVLDTSGYAVPLTKLCIKNIPSAQATEVATCRS